MKKIAFSAVIAAFFLVPISSSQAYFWNFWNTQDSSALTVTEEELLTYGQQEERMARDVYLTLAEEYGIKVFSNIARSEKRHMDSMGRLLDSHDLSQTTGYGELEEMKNDLVAKGMTSQKDALEVGVMIEVFDILDLKKSLEETDRSDIENALKNLLRGSYNHLNAFTRQLQRVGYTPDINWETGEVTFEEYVGTSQNGGNGGRGNGNARWR